MISFSSEGATVVTVDLRCSPFPMNVDKLPANINICELVVKQFFSVKGKDVNVCLSSCRDNLIRCFCNGFFSSSCSPG